MGTLKVDNGWHGPGWYAIITSEDGMADNDYICHWRETQGELSGDVREALSYMNLDNPRVAPRVTARYMGNDYTYGPDESRIDGLNSWYVETPELGLETVESRRESAWA